MSFTRRLCLVRVPKAATVIFSQTSRADMSAVLICAGVCTALICGADMSALICGRPERSYAVHAPAQEQAKKEQRLRRSRQVDELKALK